MFKKILKIVALMILGAIIGLVILILVFNNYRKSQVQSEEISRENIGVGYTYVIDDSKSAIKRLEEFCIKYGEYDEDAKCYFKTIMKDGSHRLSVTYNENKAEFCFLLLENFEEGVVSYGITFDDSDIFNFNVDLRLEDGTKQSDTVSYSKADLDSVPSDYINSILAIDSFLTATKYKYHGVFSVNLSDLGFEIIK